MQRIDLGMYVAIGAAVLDVPDTEVAHAVKVGSAESALAAPFAGFGDQDLYPDPVTKAAILCSRLLRNHPLPDGNKRAALISMTIFMDMHGIAWNAPDQDTLAATIERLAAREMSEEDFIAWLHGLAA